jgi:hypothetical protein
MGGPAKEGEAGTVEEKSENHQGEPTNHVLQGMETEFPCKTGDRSRIDP